MILHVDMDAFFASVEQMDHPEYRGKPVVVGGNSERGVVSAASYEARAFGIHSAIPGFMARKCPEAIFLSPRKERYIAVSRRIMTIFRSFTPLVEVVSIDEAFLDVTGCDKLFGTPEIIAASIRKQIRDQMELTCSVGVAPNKFLAKIASDMDKPDGLTIIRPEEAMAFVERLPIQKVPGVGKVALSGLLSLSIKTMGDVQQYPESFLVRKLGKFGRRLFQLAQNIDNTPVVPQQPPKSISSEETFSTDTLQREFLNKRLLYHAQLVARQLRKQGLRAKTVRIRIKHSDFSVATRSETVSKPIQSSDAVFREAEALLDRYPLSRKVRLIGVGTTGLVSEQMPLQQDLFNPAGKDTWEKVDRAMDAVNIKFGNKMLQRGSDLDYGK